MYTNSLLIFVYMFRIEPIEFHWELKPKFKSRLLPFPNGDCHMIQILLGLVKLTSPIVKSPASFLLYFEPYSLLFVISYVYF